MGELPGRWRAGLRPALYLAAGAAVVGLLSSPQFRGYGAGRAALEIGVATGVVFVGILLLYGTGLVRPTDKRKRMPVNPWLVGIVLVALLIALLANR